MKTTTIYIFFPSVDSRFYFYFLIFFLSLSTCIICFPSFFRSSSILFLLFTLPLLLLRLFIIVLSFLVVCIIRFSCVRGGYNRIRSRFPLQCILYCSQNTWHSEYSMTVAHSSPFLPTEMLKFYGNAMDFLTHHSMVFRRANFLYSPVLALQIYMHSVTIFIVHVA